MANPVVHFEIGGRDIAASKEFFTKLFDWKIAEPPMAMIDQAGIGGHLNSLGHEPHNYVTIYVEVDALEPYLEKVKELGGKVLIPGVHLPTGSFAWFQDIDGNTLGLWQAKK